MTRLAVLVLFCFAACHRVSDDRAPPAAPPAPPRPAQAPARPAPKPAPAPAKTVRVAAIAGVTPVSSDFVIKDFTFTSGEKLPELRIHYMTLGTLRRDAQGRATNAVLVMHGTNGSGQQFARPQFADVLFGPGQPLDLTKYYVILPDDIGHGGSSKPSDGLRSKFPHYGYTDMVVAEHALVTQGLKVDRLRLVMGTSMGCMHAWMWATKWPAIMDAVMPLACLPTQIAGRNRLWRKMIIDAIQSDPAWNNGDYTTQPRAALQNAGHLLTIAGSSPLADQKRMATRDDADREAAAAAARFASYDANDLLYAISSSRDYDPSADLENITAPVVFINSADDFINPPELGIAERMIKRVKRGRFRLIPASEATKGHGTHTWAEFWKQDLKELLDSTARK